MSRGHGVKPAKPVRAGRFNGREAQKLCAFGEIVWGLAHTWLSIAQEDKARARRPATLIVQGPHARKVSDEA